MMMFLQYPSFVILLLFLDCIAFRISSPPHHVSRRRGGSLTFLESATPGRFASSVATLLSTTSSSSDLDSSGITNTDASSSKIGSITFLVSRRADIINSKFGASSPVGYPSLLEAVEHISNKAEWFADGRVETSIVRVPNEDESSNEENNEFFQFLVRRPNNILIAIGLAEDDDGAGNELDFARRVFAARRSASLLDPQIRRSQCQFALDCRGSSNSSSSSSSSPIPPAAVGPFDQDSPSLASLLFPWTEAATARRLHEQMSSAFDRWTSEDFCYALMLFFNQFVGEIDWVKHSIDATWEKGPVRNAKELYNMITKCGDCITECVQDDKCRECITKLTEVDSRDQVQSYRTLVSYESDLLREFSLCILTKNNIFNCDAAIPTIPKVTPISTWRKRLLSEEAARSILVAHLDDVSAPKRSLRKNVSWKVCCGANPAYDQFPSQHQLFYPAARGRDMWYDPVFRVRTIDGRDVWCKRHYKVRPASVPGTFRLSVLDNGVTSNEFWTIVGAANDLSWVVFHYAGAASAVGQRYLGGLLCTPDGSLPAKDQLPRIWDCFRKAGIQPWELYTVDNDENAPGAKAAGPPPLNYYRDQVLAKRAASN